VAGRGGHAAVLAFLRDDAPAGVAAAVAACLPAGVDVVVPAPLRVKLKPGRSLVAWYDVAVPGAGHRHAVVAWATPEAPVPRPAQRLVEEARSRRVLAPFHCAFAASPDGRTSLRVAPVDAAFPQLVRLHDRTHLRGALRDAGVSARGNPAVQTVRFWPGQRHVLRVSLGPGGPAWFAKLNRDEGQPRAVAVAQWVAGKLAAAGLSAAAAGRAAYLPADRVTLWPEVAGRALSELLRTGGPTARRTVMLAGAALRVIHESAHPTLPHRPDAAAQAAVTLRAAQVIDVLLPAAGTRVRELAGRAVETLAALPPEPPTAMHGDFKCENLLVTGPGLQLLDFDSAGRGDPAAELGKFCADLRWCAGGAPDAAALPAAFLAGYGPLTGARMARARVYDALLQLRIAARRTPVQDPDWDCRIGAAVDRAAATLRDEAWP
jgi:aminoglycoside phosphotransferase (APT) family kinase protein